MAKLYATRETEDQGEFYFRHVMAMTAEKLHEKCHIAAELAHRDMRIAELEAWIESHREEFTDQRIVSNTEIDQILGKVSHEQS